MPRLKQVGQKTGIAAAIVLGSTTTTNQEKKMKTITTMIFVAGLGLALAACGMESGELDWVGYGSETDSMLTDWEHEKVGCVSNEDRERLSCPSLSEGETDRGCYFGHQMCHSKDDEFPNGYCEKWCPGTNQEERPVQRESADTLRGEGKFSPTRVDQ
ncbi:MAG: hypothetical protein QGI45_15415 [Myxococcota bacterium]|nr:hypothetical protein [Myxococcota bacterium]